MVYILLSWLAGIFVHYKLILLCGYLVVVFIMLNCETAASLIFSSIFADILLLKSINRFWSIIHLLPYLWLVGIWKYIASEDWGPKSFCFRGHVVVMQDVSIQCIFPSHSLSFENCLSPGGFSCKISDMPCLQEYRTYLGERYLFCFKIDYSYYRYWFFVPFG